MKLKLNPVCWWGPGQFWEVAGGALTRCSQFGRTSGSRCLLLHGQIRAAASTAPFQLQLGCQLHPFLGREGLGTAIHSLVASQLLPLKMTRKMQLAENAAAAHVLLMDRFRYQHMTLILKAFHWLPIQGAGYLTNKTENSSVCLARPRKQYESQTPNLK